MNKPLILNPAQAEAVYSAMCALNNVGGSLYAVIPDGYTVSDNEAGLIHVVKVSIVRGVPSTDEWHNSQAAFATAYGLNPDA